MRAALLILLPACTLSHDVLNVPVDDARSAILVIQSDQTEVIAIDARGSPFITLPLPDASADLFLYQYGCTLEALGLAPGTQNLTVPGRPIPATDRLFIGVEESTWTPVAAVPSAVASIRLEGSPCVSFELDTFPMEGRSANLLVRTTPGKALLSKERFYEVTSAGATALTALSTNTPSFAGIYREGELWLLGDHGRMVRGLPETGFVPAPSLSSQSGQKLAWLDSAPDDEPFEMFAMTDARIVEHFDGTSWSVLGQEDGETLDDQSDIARIAEGEAIAVGLVQRDLLRWRADGTRTREDLPLPIGDTPTLAIFFPDIGLLIGTHDGALVEWESGTITTTPIARIRALAPIDEGFLVGGDGGIVQYYQGYGFCEEAFQIGPCRHIVSLEPGVYAVSTTSNLGIFTRTSPPILQRCP